MGVILSIIMGMLGAALCVAVGFRLGLAVAMRVLLDESYKKWGRSRTLEIGVLLKRILG